MSCVVLHEEEQAELAEGELAMVAAVTEAAAVVVFFPAANRNQGAMGARILVLPPELRILRFEYFEDTLRLVQNTGDWVSAFVNIVVAVRVAPAEHIREEVAEEAYCQYCSKVGGRYIQSAKKGKQALETYFREAEARSPTFQAPMAGHASRQGSPDTWGSVAEKTVLMSVPALTAPDPETE